MVHNLFLLYFARREDPDNNFDRHVALFVKEDGTEEGPLLHAIENHDKITEDVLVLSFDEKHGDPKRHRSFHSEVHVGTIADDKVDSLRNICKNTPDVVAPQTSRKPDCVTWIDNVLYDLHKHRVVNFNKGFKVPTAKKPLQVCSEGRRQPGSSSSSSSSSKSKAKKDKSSSSGK